MGSSGPGPCTALHCSTKDDLDNAVPTAPSSVGLPSPGWTGEAPPVSVSGSASPTAFASMAGRQARQNVLQCAHTHTRPVRLVTPRKSPNHKCRTCKMLLLNASIKIEIESKSNRDRVWWGARQNQQYRVLERRYATRSGRTLSLSLSLCP